MRRKLDVDFGRWEFGGGHPKVMVSIKNIVGGRIEIKAFCPINIIADESFFF